MRRPIPSIALNDFLASLRDRTANGVMNVALDGGELTVSVQLREAPAVLFSFNGAVDRARFSLPFFSATGIHRHVPASVINLSDPGLLRNEEIRLAWYAGHEGFELQKLLPVFFQGVADSLGASRVAFAGSSGGGFSALYYSWHMPGSVAVVSNPQTNVRRYYRSHIAHYHAACWPSIPSSEQLKTVVDTDLAELYGSQVNNIVIYLQVASDFFHITRQCAPFLTALPRQAADQLILRMDTWGRQGHQPVPSHVGIPWLNAALLSPETNAQAITETWTMEQSPSELQPPTIPTERRDEAIAKAIASSATEYAFDRDAPVKRSI